MLETVPGYASLTEASSGKLIPRLGGIVSMPRVCDWTYCIDFTMASKGLLATDYVES